MAHIELVIKIPEVYFEALKKTDEIVSGQRSGKTFMSVICESVAKGIPLPKGHDKLIDVKDLREQICLEDTKENRKLNLGEIITLEDIDRIEPIIEADRE